MDLAPSDSLYDRMVIHSSFKSLNLGLRFKLGSKLAVRYDETYQKDKGCLAFPQQPGFKGVYFRNLYAYKVYIYVIYILHV